MRYPANGGDHPVVSVCGRAMEVSPESLSSVWLLRNELVSKLSVSGPASLQLADSSGAPIRMDEELSVAFRAGHHPLQVTLTDMALHEIENKKRDMENKKEEMTQLQWQIIREQVKHFSAELASVVGQVQSVRDFCQLTMQEFQEQEELRGERTIAAIVQEASEREAVQKDLAARLDQVAQMIAEERTVREVQDLQLAKQSEIQANEIGAMLNNEAREHSETTRSIAA